MTTCITRGGRENLNLDSFLNYVYQTTIERSGRVTKVKPCYVIYRGIGKDDIIVTLLLGF
jgi:hypothetical protein